jgi:hypothetical protein
LSKAIRGGRLTDGVQLDGRDRVIVTDAAAAADQWREIHTPTVAELCRPTPPSARPRPAPPPADPDFYDLADPEQDLGLRADAADLLGRVLVAMALEVEGADPRVFANRAIARMAVSGLGFCDDAEIFDEATLMLRELVDEVIDPLGELDDQAAAERAAQARREDDAAALEAIAAVDRL